MSWALVALFWAGSAGRVEAVSALEADGVRVAAHLERAVAMLLAADASTLDASQRTRRARAVDALRAYQERGVFPVNPKLDGGRAPIWIDAHGTPCAMAHLVSSSGERELADAVAARENNAYLPDMRTEGLGEWLVDNGISLEEAAVVQPTYCSCPRERVLVCGVDGRTYLNECVATMCAGVEVLQAGACETEGGTDGWPPAGSSGGGEGESSGSTPTGSASTSSTGATSDGGTETTTDESIEEPRGESAGRGCSTTRGRSPLLLVSILVLAARNWRRR